MLEKPKKRRRWKSDIEGPKKKASSIRSHVDGYSRNQKQKKKKKAKR